MAAGGAGAQAQPPFYPYNPKPLPDIKQLVNYAAQNLVPDDAVRALARGLKQIELWTDLNGSRWKKVEGNFKFYNEGTFKFYEEPGSGPKVTIRDLLPGFASALDEVHACVEKLDFIKAMPEAVAKGEAPDEQPVDGERLEITKIEFGKLYEAARHLLTEIELVAEDPVAPLKVEARQLLAELRGSLSEVFSSTAIANQLKDAFETADAIDAEVIKLFKKWLTGAEGLRWRRNILFLDEPLLQWPTGVDDLATRFITCFARSLQITGPVAG